MLEAGPSWLKGLEEKVPNMQSVRPFMVYAFLPERNAYISFRAVPIDSGSIHLYADDAYESSSIEEMNVKGILFRLPKAILTNELVWGFNNSVLLWSEISNSEVSHNEVAENAL